ncbi:hypothetical protein HanXRQr2_Chr16g0744731 [Helianthus annuus]|uniref:Uncharacterized protein n=1 Tax=Helianthus annuus TaxID=4232 RepID=A0A9K3DQD4_HELAN|nr:hypothetical protein HanXRQr2_Chr16g0744731 [Helianthus annuus]KAJ0820934.1 hypothetical protein HanPSC8_Chr16g0714021 [Helianthus annuus]
MHKRRFMGQLNALTERCETEQPDITRDMKILLEILFYHFKLIMVTKIPTHYRNMAYTHYSRKYP